MTDTITPWLVDCPCCDQLGSHGEWGACRYCSGEGLVSRDQDEALRADGERPDCIGRTHP